jgi:hypothetical protein
MATEQAPAGGDQSYQSNADLRLKQYYILELLSTGKVDVCNATGDVGFGVLQNKPNTNEAARVRLHFGSKTKVVSDGSGTNIAVGDYVGTSSAGKAIKKSTDKDFVLGVAESASTADGTIITVRLQPGYLAV